MSDVIYSTVPQMIIHVQLKGRQTGVGEDWTETSLAPSIFLCVVKSFMSKYMNAGGDSMIHSVFTEKNPK